METRIKEELEQNITHSSPSQLHNDTCVTNIDEHQNIVLYLKSTPIRAGRLRGA